MSLWLPIFASSAGGAGVTLLGVITGGWLANLSQSRQSIRDKQISACTAIIEESTQVQLALLRQQRTGTESDWTAWNQALAVIWLVGVPEVNEAAAKMDRIFWVNGTKIKAGLITDGESWALARDQMETARLEFINAARRNIVRFSKSLTTLPVARPPLAELISLSRPSVDPGGDPGHAPSAAPT